MGSKGTNTVTQQSQPPAQFMQAYTNLLNQGNQVASQPLQQYQGSLVAGFTGDQANAFNQVEQASGIADPYYNTAAQYAAQGATPTNIQQFSGQNIQQYQNPYTQQVIDTTMANVNQQNQLQQQNLLSQGIKQGNAFGGDRAGLAQSALANQQDLAKNQTIAGLESAGYGQALGEFNTQQQTQLQQQANDAARAAQASYQFGNIGQGLQGSALTGANALLNTGQQQQALAQQQLNIPYGQFQQQQAYPFQTTNFLAGLTSGLGSQAGGSSQTTGPGASQLGQYLGLGQLGLGAYNAFGGAGAAAGAGTSIAGLSDIMGSGAAGLGSLAFLGMKSGGIVPHYDVGGQTGTPGDPMMMGVPLSGITKGIPNVGALSYLQPIQIHGSGPPKAPNVPHVNQDQQLAANVKQAQNLVSGLGKDFGSNNQPSTATSYIDNVLAQSNPQQIMPQPDDMGSSGNPTTGGYASGGLVPHYAMGGPSPMQGLGLANAFGNLTGSHMGPMNTAMGNASINGMLNKPQQGMSQGGVPHYRGGGSGNQNVYEIPSPTGIATPQINSRAFQFNPNITGSSGGVAQQQQMPPWMQGLGAGQGMPGMQGGGNQMPPFMQNGQGTQGLGGQIPPWMPQGGSQSGLPQLGASGGPSSAQNAPAAPAAGTFQGTNGPLYSGPSSQQYGQPMPNMQPQKIGSGYNSVYALPQIPLSSMPNPNTVYTTGSTPPPTTTGSQSSGLGNPLNLSATSNPFLGTGANDVNLGGMSGMAKGGLVPHFDEAGAVDEAALPADAVPASVPQDANVSAKQPRDMTPYQQAIHSVESADQKDPYSTIGPPTRSGDRALGKYQVMSQNVPGWTAEALGKPMNAQEFLHNREAQDAVFNHKFGQYLDQYGNPQDAASMWFAGKPLQQAGNVSDGYTTTPAYVSNFTQALNKASGGLQGQPGEDLDPHPEIDHSGDTVKVNYPSTKESLDTGLPGKNAWQKLFSGSAGKDVGLALMQSGLATMAAASRPGATALGSVGQGGESGLNMYLNQQHLAQQQSEKQQEFALKKQQSEQGTWYQQQEARKPFIAGQVMDQFNQPHPIYAIRGPNNTLLDPVTMKPIGPTNPTVPGQSPAGPQSPVGPSSSNAPATQKSVQLASADDDSPEAKAELANIMKGLGISQAQVINNPGDVAPDLFKNPLLSSGKQLNEGELDDLTRGQKALVKLMVQGKIAPPTSFAMAKPFWQTMIQKAALYDPDFDMTHWQARNAFLKDITSGVTARNVIRRMNTAANHMDILDKDQQSLNNWASNSFGPFTGMANEARVAWLSGQQDPRIRAVKQDATAVSNELALAFKGYDPGIAGIKEWQEGMRPGMASDESRMANNRIVKLVKGQLDSVGDQYERAFGQKVDPSYFLSPAARATYERLGAEPMPGSGAAPVQGKMSAGDRFNQLIGSGFSKQDAYAKMHQEGF